MPSAQPATQLKNQANPEPLMTTTTHSDSKPALSFATRFGEVQLDASRLISFPHGLFGFRDCTEFGLAKVPNLENSPILLLQCTTDATVAFLVADPAALGLEIAETDRAAALGETKFSPADTQFLTILNIYDNVDSYFLTANLRAPLLVDSAKRTAIQHILANPAYTTQHKV